MNGLRVMVFGGTGFVGRQLCAELASAGANVLAIARRPGRATGDWRFLAMDLGACAPEQLAGWLAAERPDVIVNTTGSIWGVADERMTDVCTTPSIRLVAALESLSRRPRLVHLGSVLEYGPIRPGEQAGPALPARPTTAHGRAKLAATRRVLDAARAGRIDAVVLRVVNVAGPGAPAISLLGRAAGQLAAADRTDPVVEMSSLHAHRDYLDVRDVVSAIIAACTAPVTGQVIDIGRGEAVSVRALVRMMIDASGLPARLVETPGNPTAQDWTEVDPEPAARLLGWKARYDLAETVRAHWAEFAAG